MRSCRGRIGARRLLLTDEQKQKVQEQMPDPASQPTSLLLGSFDDAILDACGLKPIQKTAWTKLAAKYSK